MINKTCPLENKEKLFTILHGNCFGGFKRHPSYCEGCTYWISVKKSKRIFYEKVVRDLQNILTPLVNQPITPVVKQKRVQGLIGTYLNNLHIQMMISDYNVVCDETNNTNSQQTTVDVFIKPNQSVDIVKINIILQ